MPEFRMPNFEYKKEKTLGENQKAFGELSKEEQWNVIGRAQEEAGKDDIRKSVQKQDIETTKRAIEGRGQKLEELYSGFFGSRENCEKFAQLVPEEFYQRENAVIVDAGSKQGTLGNYMREKFQEHGSDAKLIMIDTDLESMKKSPVEAEKIEGDLLENPLPNETADLIILRSVLQYMTPENQRELLDGLRRNLKPGGILVSQFGSYDTQTQADAFNGIFMCAKRPVNFCGKNEGVELHKSVFGKVAEVSDGPTLHETLDDFFVARIAAPEDQIEAAKKYISENIETLGNVLTKKEDPYAWQIPYTIVRCEKSEDMQ